MATNHATRLDAQDVYFLNNQLQAFDPTKYYHLLPGVVGRKIMGLMQGIAPAAPVAKWRMTKLQGGTKKGSGKSRNEPTVSVVQVEETQAIKKFPAVQTFSVDDVAAARQAGEDLPEDTRRAAVGAIEQAIDTCLCTGDSLSGITGLENNANVSSQAAAAAWSGATVDQILADIKSLVSTTMLNLKQAAVPGNDMPAFNQFTLFLPEDRMITLATTRLGSTNEKSLLTFIRENFYMLKAIKPWHRLTKGVLAPALDSGIINPMAAEGIVPVDYDQLPAQFEGFNVNVPCWGRCGGVAMRYTVAFRYLTGL